MAGTTGGPLLRRLRMGRLRMKSLDFFLESFDFVPGFQAPTHNAKVEFLHKDKILVHVEKYITGDLLLFEDVTVFRVDPEVAQALCSFMLVPRAHLFLGWLILFFLIRLVTINVGHAMANMTAVLAFRIVGCFGFLVRMAVAGGAQVCDVFIDDAQRLIHNRTVLAIHMVVDCLLEGLLDIESHIPMWQRGRARSLRRVRFRRRRFRGINRGLDFRSADMPRSLRGALSTL